MNSNGGVYCNDLPLTQFLQLHVLHVQIMMLHHDVILYSMVSMPESYFRTEAGSGVTYDHLQLCIHYITLYYIT